MANTGSNDEPLFRQTRDVELANAIGSLFINFALMNSQLNGAVAMQQGLTLEQAQALILPLQTRPKIEMFQWFAEHHWTKLDIERVKDLCNRARAITDFRNHIAHDDMVLPNPEGEVHLVTYSGKHRFDPTPRPLPASEVSHAALVAHHIAQEFRALSLEIAQGKIARKADRRGTPIPRRPKDAD